MGVSNQRCSQNVAVYQADTFQAVPQFLAVFTFVVPRCRCSRHTASCTLRLLACCLCTTFPADYSAHHDAGSRYYAVQLLRRRMLMRKLVSNDGPSCLSDVQNVR